ncbi:YidC/Oxa1 family membrane protein insertase [Chloroflexota bacterium]
MSVGGIWDLIILNPIINVLITLSGYLLNSVGLAIILLTILVNLLMYPLTQKQLRASRAMQEIQGEIGELRKKYAKDRQKLAQEQMKVMKESGASYWGCLMPMLIQMPVWIVLYQSIIRVLATAPEDLLNLSQRLFVSWPDVFAQVPMNSSFLWLDLALPNMFMAILVGILMWVQQKMQAPATTDPKQQAQSQMMQWMMPLMFAMICFSVPSGLALYWVTSTAMRIIMQYFATGWGGLVSSKGDKKGPRIKENKGREARQKTLKESDISADIVVEPSSAREEGSDYGESGDQRQDSRRSDPTSLRSIRRQSGGGRSQRRKRS